MNSTQEYPCLQGTYSHRTAGLIHYDPHLNQSRWMQSDTKGGCSALPFAATTKSNNNAHNKFKKENFLYMKCSKADNESLNPMPNFNKTWKVGQTGNGKELTERTEERSTARSSTASHGDALDTLSGSPDRLVRSRKPMACYMNTRLYQRPTFALHWASTDTSHPFCCRNIKPQRASA